MTATFRTLLCCLALGLPAAAQAQKTTAPAPGAPATTNEYLLGRTYRVETTKGTTFTGSLVGLSLNGLEFESQELGHISLERDQVRRAELQGEAPGKTKSGYYDIGNGTRIFNAPTGRGLRKGEGTIQTTYLFLVGAEYGITNNFSVGATVSLLPGVPLSQQAFVLAPKFTAPISEKVHFGAGVIYANIPFDNRDSGGAGIGYGSLTYGGAEDNLTLGIGYGFTSGEIGSTPVLQLGGQKRISRRISLLSENYIVADSKAGMGGLYGVKFNWRRTSLGVAAAYVYLFAHDEQSFDYSYNPNTGTYTTRPTTQRVGGEFGTSYIIPVYLDFAFRFGKK
jgi:hypothetical protein